MKPEGKLSYLAAARREGGVLLPLLKKMALETSGGGHPEGTECLHPSEMAKEDWCPRATYYRITTGVVQEDTFSFVLENIFDEGNSIHRKWQDRLAQTGKLWGDWQCLVCYLWEKACLKPTGGSMTCRHVWEYKEVSLWNGLIRGHEDGAMDDYMVEIKSIGIGTLRHDAPETLKKYYVETVDGEHLYDLDKFWKNLKRPFISHVRQANVYLYLAERMGLPYKTVRFLYECKWNQQVKEFVIKKSDRILKPILTRAKSVTYALECHEPPPCPWDGCKQCEEYENAGKASVPGGAVPARRLNRRSGEATGPGDRPGEVGSPSRRGVPRRAARPDGGPGPGAHDAVPGGAEVGEVPGASALGGRGGRVLRRKGGNPYRGTEGV